MANFDSNRWYQLDVGPVEGQSMVGTTLFDEQLRGAVFFQVTNLTSPLQNWQVYPFNSSYYVLRTEASGPYGYLSVKASVDETTNGNTVPFISNASIVDNSMFWQILPWDDGTFFFTNAVNGSAWHLFVKDNSLMAMSSNITAPQTRQEFTFNATGTIDDVRYSSVVLPNSATSAATSATSSSGTSTTSSTSSGGGLSTGAKAAAIGASIGGVAVLVLLALGFWFLRRRRRRRESDEDSTNKVSASPPSETPPQSTAELKGSQHFYTPPPSELPHTSPPSVHELEGGGTNPNELAAPEYQRTAKSPAGLGAAS